MRQVSKAWNILALDGSNWQYVDLFEFQIDIEGIVVENIARRCGGFLRKLSLRGCQAVGDNALATFSQYCNNIEHLDLKYCKKISDRTSQSLSMHCHKLQVRLCQKTNKIFFPKLDRIIISFDRLCLSS